MYMTWTKVSLMPVLYTYLKMSVILRCDIENSSFLMSECSPYIKNVLKLRFAMHYSINPDRNFPWNDFPLLPKSEPNYKLIDVYGQLGKEIEGLGLLSGRLIAIPDPTTNINSLALILRFICLR